MDLNIRYKYKNEEYNIGKAEDEKNVETEQEEEKNIEKAEDEKNVGAIQEEKNIETDEEEEKNVEVIQEEKDIQKIVEREKERRAKQRKENFLGWFMLLMFALYILFPWIIAKEGVIWWKKILSYFPLFICFILITGGFIHIVSGKSKNWFFTIMVIFLFSYLCWRAASLLLL